ncbi:metallophosphoesterase family protein [Aliarcobacter butzleri]|uniref:metallophosphoesterase family protein n=1 Tax=Aliarcobacter butzleri TaxID=28197 RepID=UPI00263DA2C6|nr:metallophosphoesterase [Aliarcobacter butzleri]MDN5091061.1 metallophosphoesterase [Aliarcobacter butzleri]
MHLLHISDPHFSTEKYAVKAHNTLDGLIELIKNIKKNKNLYILITGDITFKGKSIGFKEAKNFFKKLIEKTNLDRKRILICPGNHDISDDNNIKNFEGFNIFAYGLRRDNIFKFTMDRTNNIYFKDGNCFLSINSSYELNYKYGKIDISNLASLLKKKKDEISDSKMRIIFCHHHLLNLEDKDDSAIKNAYQFFELIKQYNFHFLFHGHQHAKQVLKINDIYINSVSSLLETRSVSNLIALYKIKKIDKFKRREYTYFKDETNKIGKRGRYRRLC